MKKFLVLYCSPTAPERPANASPEELKKGMEPWLAWFEKAGSAVVEQGAPVSGGVDVKKDGVDPSQTWIRGYSIFQGENIDEIKKIAAESPTLAMMPDSFVEILEAMPMEM